jgi:TRAP transporter TAXI family solute receptor
VNLRGPRVWLVAVGLGAAGCVAAVALRPAAPPAGTMTITSGTAQGVYHAFGAELADQLRRRDKRLSVTVLQSTGSLQNLERLAAGSAGCGLTAADAAVLAMRGGAPFSRPVPITAVARVYDDYVHLIARSGARIRSLSDLRGKRVSLGEPGSGVRLVSARILQAARVSVDSVHDSRLGLTGSLRALADGRIDAFFWSGGVPTGSVTTLLRSTQAQVVPLGAVASSLVRHYGSVYRAGTIAADVYPGMAAVDTVAVPNFLVCRSDTPAPLVKELITTLFSAQDMIAVRVPPINTLDQRTAIATEPVPLHPAALAWYRRAKP